MDPRNIKIVSEYREPKDNEFFPAKRLISYPLEDKP